ncbi:Frataxin/CyaY [Dillenia turbinata]|uniref:ferroxidase n=1 Tax=Dillenia turbinata TaxID=194707 RepID=A0AAN8Z346_9MAGN
MASRFSLKLLRRKGLIGLPMKSSQPLVGPSKSLYSLASTVQNSLSSISHNNFSSRSLNLNDDSPGTAAIDYRSLLQEDEYHKLADSTIQDLLEKLEEYGDSIEVDGFDIDYGNQVLTLKLGSLGTYVLNKQTPNRQLWLSSPVSGPSRFDWDHNAQAWIYRRTRANLVEVLESELEKLCVIIIKYRSIL